MQTMVMQKFWGVIEVYYGIVQVVNRWFSADVTAAMLVYRTIEKKAFWAFDSIILMQNMSHNLPLREPIVLCTNMAVSTRD